MSANILWLVESYRFSRMKPDEAMLAQHFLVTYNDQELEFSVALVPKPAQSRYMDLKLKLVSGKVDSVINMNMMFYIEKREQCFHTMLTLTPDNTEVAWLDAAKCPKVAPYTKIKFGLDVQFKSVSGTTNVLNVTEILETLTCYADLLHKGVHYDVIFEVESTEIKAHKSILSVRNHVFAAMFEHGYSESIASRVVIEDISVKTFNALLMFLYTAVVPGANAMDIDLFKAAHKYDMRDLQMKCVAALLRSLNVDNAIDLLILFELYDLETQKRSVVKFINNNAERIMNDVSWIQFAKTHPALLIELYKHAKNDGKRSYDDGYQSSASSSYESLPKRRK